MRIEESKKKLLMVIFEGGVGERPEHRPSQGPKNIQSDQGLLVTLTSFFYALFTYLPLRPSSNIMLIPWIVKNEPSLAVLA